MQLCDCVPALLQCLFPHITAIISYNGIDYFLMHERDIKVFHCIHDKRKNGQQCSSLKENRISIYIYIYNNARLMEKDRTCTA